MNSSFYGSNRDALRARLKGGLVVVSAYAALQRSNDAAHPFVQESNFKYLSGIDEPDWVLICDGQRNYSWLVAPHLTESQKTFDGELSAAQAKDISGVNEVVSSEEMPDLLRRLARTHKSVHTVGTHPHAEYFSFDLNPAPERTRQMLARIFTSVEDCRKDLAQLRAVKQPEELKMIRRAVSVTTSAFENIRANMPQYKNEYEIEADFAHHVRMLGADGIAYDSIVAAGMNACTLHYSKNNAKLRPKQLVLLDMGASYGGYAADITRTYSRGHATKRQVEVHDAVERAHHKIIAMLEPMLSVEDYQRKVDGIMADALGELGLGSGEEQLRRYFPHAVSHGLGIDVHDSLGAPKYFQQGMVLTVEPGIYIPEESIGVRIEDDILITANGHENLSASLSTGL
jgi:Xaa-Pro aminopeptidase